MVLLSVQLVPEPNESCKSEPKAQWQNSGLSKEDCPFTSVSVRVQPNEDAWEVFETQMCDVSLIFVG